MRLLRWALATLVLCSGGCKNQPKQLDPFLGKTTVAPPPTGSVGPQAPGVLAYPAAPPTMSAPSMAGPATTTPSLPTTPPFTSPTTPGPVTSAPPPTAPSVPNPPPRVLTGTTPAPGSPPTQFVNSSNPIRVVPPDPNASRTVVAPGTNPARGVDIMDLPVRGQGTQPKTATGAPRTTQPSSASTFDPNNAQAKSVTLAPQPTSYGYDDSYSRLSGRLEYSPLDGRWLLRYVAPENKPDRFGGVAVLVPAGTMAGFRNGDFVTASGKFEAAGSASPVFTASTIAAQRDMR